MASRWTMWHSTLTAKHNVHMLRVHLGSVRVNETQRRRRRRRSLDVADVVCWRVFNFTKSITNVMMAADSIARVKNDTLEKSIEMANVSSASCPLWAMHKFVIPVSQRNSLANENTGKANKQKKRKKNCTYGIEPQHWKRAFFSMRTNVVCDRLDRTRFADIYCRNYSRKRCGGSKEMRHSHSVRTMHPKCLAIRAGARARMQRKRNSKNINHGILNLSLNWPI